MWLYVVAISVLCGAYAFYKYVWKSYEFWTRQGVYVPSVDSNISFINIVRGKQGFNKLVQEYYDLARKKKQRYYGGMEVLDPVLFIADLELVKRVFVKDFDHFINRREFTMKNGNEAFAKILFNMEGEEWKDMRTIMSPTFTTGKIRRMFEVVNLSGERLVSFLNEECKDNEVVDLQDAMGRLAMDVIASAAFGVNSQIFEDKDAMFSKMGKKLIKEISPLLLVKLLILVTVPKLNDYISVKFFDQNALDFFTDMIKCAIKFREESGQVRNDFLQLMLEARDGQLKVDDDEVPSTEKDANTAKNTKSHRNVNVTDDLIVAQCILFIFGGFDTTSSLLTFAAYQLAVCPDMQARLVSDIEKELENSDGKFTYDWINRLEYLDMFISETLRMYPPIIQLERRCTIDYQIPDSDLTIPKDRMVIIPVYGIHMDEEYWPEPHRFDPERFSAENKADRNTYAYMPFGHGQRSCIANRLALTEAKTAVARLVYNFTIEPSEKTQIPIEFAKTGTLKPKDGMWLRIKPRQH